MNTLAFNVRRFVVAAFCMAIAVLASHSSAFAKECDEGKCNIIKIVNYTKFEYKMMFLLCCDGEYKETDCYGVPLEKSKIEFPGGCTVLKWAFCHDVSPKICTKWDESECVLYIYYCP